MTFSETQFNTMIWYTLHLLYDETPAVPISSYEAGTEVEKQWTICIICWPS
jgi:hypothetical protein